MDQLTVPKDSLALMAVIDTSQALDPDFPAVSLAEVGNLARAYQQLLARQTPSFATQVAEFHRTFRVPVQQTPGFPDAYRVDLRVKLIIEEFKELMTALGVQLDDFEYDFAGKQDLVEVADALCDLHYVLSGTSLEFGLLEDALFAEVHRSNMSKANEDGTVNFREDGKVLKSARWSPPRIQELLGVQ